MKVSIFRPVAFIHVFQLMFLVCGATTQNVKLNYAKVIHLENFGATDTPISTSTGIPHIGACSSLCFEEAQCMYFRLYGDECSLYTATPQTSGALHGASYYTKYGGEII